MDKQGNIITAQVQVKRLDARGLGIAQVEGQDVTVPFVLPGEEAEIQVIHPKRRQPWGKLLGLTPSSLDRQDPACPHFTTCGGCLLQHLTPQAYKDFKVGSIRHLLVENGLPTDSIREPHFIGPGQRRRIDISGRKTDKGLVLGFHNINSKRPFNVEQCAVLHPDIEKLFKPLHTLLDGLMVEREKIHVFFTVADNGVDLMLAGLKREFPEEGMESLIHFAKEYDLVRLVFKINKRRVLYQRETPTISFGGVPVEIASNAFLQASAEADHILSQLVLQNIPEGTKTVADLFCGRGTLSLPMIQAGYEVDGYECDDHALTALGNTQAPGLRLHNRNLFDDPLTTGELTPYNVVVLDPPRSGIKDQVIALGEARVPRLIYVSCGPESFAKDGAELIARGYTLTSLALIDQFIWTPHMELVGVFDHPSSWMSSTAK